MSHAQRVAEIIKRQIGIGPLMSVGAHQFAYTSDPEGLTFKARLCVEGQTKVRIMRVNVSLTPSDTYEVKVTFCDRGRYYSSVQENIYADMLPKVLLDLDSHGVARAPMAGAR